MIYKSGVGHDRLEDLIAGVTPTYSGWTVDPTDGADITDGDISTACTTGNKVAGGGFQYGYFEWDLGAFYNILCTGVGYSSATAGNPLLYFFLWNGAAWITSDVYAVGYAAVDHAMSVYGGVCSKVRVGIASDAAATITPNIREFHAWRLQ